jgi:hypothetical protein
LAWLGGLAVLAGVALVAGRPDSGPPNRPAVAVRDQAREVPESPVTTAPAAPWQATRPNVVLARPGAGGHVTAGELAVVGRLGSLADTVIVSIRTRREHLIDTDRVVTSLDKLGFEATVRVPGPAGPDDTSRVWLEIIGYTYDGVPVAGTVAVLRVHAAPPPRLLGDDGGMGALGVGERDAQRPSPPLYWPVGRLSWQVNPAQR